MTTAPLTDTAGNDSFSTITGTLVGHDLDSDETSGLQYSALDAGTPTVNTAVAGLYGSLTVGTDGSYNYVPDAAAINALHDGTYHDTFTVQTADASGATGTATFTVDVTGANDTPTLDAVTAGPLTDTADNDSFSTVTGTLVGQTSTAARPRGCLCRDRRIELYAVNIAVAGHYGSLTVGTDGSYNYVPDAAAINALGEGNCTDTFSLQTTDANGDTGIATFTVDVTGVNDAPLFNGTDLGSTYHAGDAAVPLAGGVSASDIDSDNYAGGSLTATVIAGGNPGDTLTIVGDQYITLDGTTVMFDADGTDGGDCRGRDRR